MSKFELFYKPSLLCKPLLLSALLLMPLCAHSASQKELDKARADGDVATLAAIAGDAATEDGVRIGAVESLPFAESLKMIDSDLYQKSQQVRYILLNRIGFAGQLAVEKYPAWVRACIAYGDGWGAATAQSGYVNAL